MNEGLNILDPTADESTEQVMVTILWAVANTTSYTLHTSITFVIASWAASSVLLISECISMKLIVDKRVDTFTRTSLPRCSQNDDSLKDYYY